MQTSQYFERSQLPGTSSQQQVQQQNIDDMKATPKQILFAKNPSSQNSLQRFTQNLRQSRFIKPLGYDQRVFGNAVDTTLSQTLSPGNLKAHQVNVLTSSPNPQLISQQALQKQQKQIQSATPNFRNFKPSQYETDEEQYFDSNYKQNTDFLGFSNNTNNKENVQQNNNNNNKIQLDTRMNSNVSIVYQNPEKREQQPNSSQFIKNLQNSIIFLKNRQVDDSQQKLNSSFQKSVAQISPQRPQNLNQEKNLNQKMNIQTTEVDPMRTLNDTMTYESESTTTLESQSDLSKTDPQIEHVQQLRQIHQRGHFQTINNRKFRELLQMEQSGTSTQPMPRTSPQAQLKKKLSLHTQQPQNVQFQSDSQTENFKTGRRSSSNSFYSNVLEFNGDQEKIEKSTSVQLSTRNNEALRKYKSQGNLSTSQFGIEQDQLTQIRDYIHKSVFEGIKNSVERKLDSMQEIFLGDIKKVNNQMAQIVVQQSEIQSIMGLLQTKDDLYQEREKKFINYMDESKAQYVVLDSRLKIIEA